MEKPRIQVTPAATLVEKVEKAVGIAITILSRTDQIDGTLYGFSLVPERSYDGGKTEPSVDERMDQLNSLLEDTAASLDRILSKLRG